MTITEAEIQKLLPYCRRIVDMNGFAVNAGDGSNYQLALARANAERKAVGWCECKEEGEQFYWQSQSGSHGWLCGKCRRTTQLG